MTLQPEYPQLELDRSNYRQPGDEHYIAGLGDWADIALAGERIAVRLDAAGRLEGAIADQRPEGAIVANDPRYIWVAQ